MLDEEIPEKIIRVRLSNKLWITTHINGHKSRQDKLYVPYISYITACGPRGYTSNSMCIGLTWHC